MGLLSQIGLFGGTFDPIHSGHLDVARAAADALGLRRVWFVPSRVPPHRAEPRASAAHRFAMAALAIQHDERFLMSDVEMASEAPSYTVATLDRLDARGGIDTRKLVFIAGADAFADVTSWKGYPALLDRCMFAVVSRPTLPAPALRQRLAGIAPRMIDFNGSGGLGAVTGLPIFLIDAPTAPVSSTAVREHAARGEALTGLVPPAVAAYISRHSLYTSNSSSGVA